MMEIVILLSCSCGGVTGYKIIKKRLDEAQYTVTISLAK